MAIAFIASKSKKVKLSAFIEEVAKSEGRPKRVGERLGEVNRKILVIGHR